jgi:tRNA pseudouridine(55) synthase
MRKKTIIKSVGQTPLERLELFRNEEQLPQDTPLAYAGRLDPMASGKLLVLIGDECKKLKEYTGLDKEYEVEVLLGVSTDTGDLLGFIHEENNKDKEIRPSELEQGLKELVGRHKWEYPIFSSKTVKGKPLFQWFYEGQINEIEVPKTDTDIYSAELQSVRTVTAEELHRYITDSIAKITPVVEESKKLGSDFRRVPILARWDQFFADKTHKQCMLAKIRVVCGSGSYMRTFAEKLGEKLDTPACAYSIHRTRIGTYRHFGPISFWFPEY